MSEPAGTKGLQIVIGAGTGLLPHADRAGSTATSQECILEEPSEKEHAAQAGGTST